MLKGQSIFTFKKANPFKSMHASEISMLQCLIGMAYYATDLWIMVFQTLENESVTFFSVRGNVRSGKCPSGKCPVGETSVGEMSVGETSVWGNVRS